MKITVDFGKCTGLGLCESIAPQYFEVNDDGDLVLLEEAVGADDLALIENAIASCPTEALKLEV